MDRELVRVIAYVIKTESGEEKNFFGALEKAGIETRSKDLQIFLGGAKKGDWDVGMTVDAIRLAPSVDAVVIVSGDGDFIPLVEYLKFNSGCQVEVATFKSTVSSGLIEVADDFYDLADNLDRYLIRKNFRVYRKNYSVNMRKKPIQKIDKNLENNIVLEKETPEMVSERVTGKRNIPKKVTNSKVVKKKVDVVPKKKATEVTISRIKKKNKEKTEEKKKKEKKKSFINKKVITKK